MPVSLRIFLFLIFILSANINAQTILFNNLTVADGLSSNDVNTLIQDNTGFIWFGTEDGLNRYDGYSFKIFRNDPSDSNSISGNSIWAIKEDSKGYIWIGTKDGVLNQFNPTKETFTRWILKPKLKENNSITALYEDKKGNIWAGTRSAGVYQLNPATKEIKQWNTDSSGSAGLSHHSVRSITENESGKILVGTYFGLNIFDPSEPRKEVIKFYNEDDNPNSLSDSQIYNFSLSAADSDIIWIGTPKGLTEYNSKNNSFRRIKIPNPGKLQFGSGASSVIEQIIDDERILWVDTYSGLVRMNMQTGEWQRFVHNENNNSSIISNQINKIIKDKSGVIWIATENGVSFYSSKSSRFNSVFNKKHQFYLNAVKENRDLKAIIQNNGELWMGFNNGIKKIMYGGETGNVYEYPALKNLNIWSLAFDDSNKLWIGTFGQGLKQFDSESGKLKDWKLIYSKTSRPAVPFIKSLFKDSRNNIWIGFWGTGICRLNPVTGEYKIWITELDNPESLSFSDVWVIKEDSFGRIWIGTQGGGLNLFEDRNDGVFHHWLQNKNSINSNNVFSILEAGKIKNQNDSETVLWIGTSNGLNKFVIKNKDASNIYKIDIETEYYTVKNGLPDNSVKSIIEDENGNLWIGTGSGISFFDVANEKFTNFNLSDGLNGTVMNSESSLNIDKSLMLFGSTKGLNIFDPSKINLSDYSPNVVFTDFQIYNQSVTDINNSFLKGSIAGTKELILSHDQDVFSFEFAALDFNSPELLKYAYMMEGFDKEWINSGNRRFVTYTNLDPGKYIFKVKAANADGIWNDRVTSLQVIITPPWWKTIWAYIIYSVLIILGLLGIRKFELNRTKLRNELKLREFEVKKKSELEELKSRFFANLSHEFRTPLMLIKGPLEQLKIRKSDNNFYENINLIERNSGRLQELIDQLLELSHLEKASIPLKACEMNLVPVLKGLVNSFESVVKQKNISLTFESSSEITTCWIDKDKFEKIINNILSNAVKFTPSGGNISVSLYLTKTESAEIKISDTGIGIPEDKVNKIFNRFFQVDDSTQRSFGGSGIGLALAKELVDLHKWNISVDSAEGKGTEFTLTIPLGEDYLEKNEIDRIDFINEEDHYEIKEYEIITEEKEDKSAMSESRPSVLIVDDSEDVRKYLSLLLNEKYSVSEAANGMEGIKMSEEIIPDLIISDIMMPSMDGMEFCSKIKGSWITSHIPVILLTAKASFESKIDGLEVGADAYITKPFNSRELLTRVSNLLKQRKRLKDKYSKDFEALAGAENYEQSDNTFVKQALELIHMNIDNINFGTEQLAKELFMSRTGIHRKILSLTGIPPGEFIRTTRLKRAAQLLTEGNLSITQIAYEVGFSSPAQFTRAFKKHFDSLPSEYLQKVK